MSWDLALDVCYAIQLEQARVRDHIEALSAVVLVTSMAFDPSKSEVPKPHHVAELERLRHGLPAHEEEEFFDPADGEVETNVIDWEEARRLVAERLSQGAS